MRNKRFLANTIVDILMWTLSPKQSPAPHKFTVVVSVNDNDDYCKYWPILYSAWQKVVGVNVFCAYIGNKSHYMTHHSENVVQFPTVSGVDDVLLSQIARIYLASQIHDTPVLTSDIDMFPLQSTYFNALCQRLATHKCVIATNDGYSYHRYPMCYVLFDRNISRTVINPDNKTFEQFARLVHSYSYGWDSDEKWLTNQIDSNLRDADILKLTRGFHNGISLRRIDRDFFIYLAPLLKTGYYIDMHMPKSPVDSVSIAKYLYGLLGYEL